MTEIRQPRSLEQALELLQRSAELADQAARLEARRDRIVAGAKARADRELAPIAAERDLIREKIEPWFDKAKGELLGDRKSCELGGCKVGARKSKDTLVHTFESDAKAADALDATRFRKHTLKFTHAVDKAATLKLLQVGGKTAAAIRELGFSIDAGTDIFFVERAQQAATIGA